MKTDARRHDSAPPHDFENERAALGSILVDPAMYPEVSAIVCDSDLPTIGTAKSSERCGCCVSVTNRSIRRFSLVNSGRAGASTRNILAACAHQLRRGARRPLRTHRQREGRQTTAAAHCPAADGRGNERRIGRGDSRRHNSRHRRFRHDRKRRSDVSTAHHPAELNSAHCELVYWISGVLVAGQPCIVAGGKKSLKTSLLLDMAISLAAGVLFLGKFTVERRARVLFMSGESGLPTIKETAQRIADAKGLNLSEIHGLFISGDLPQNQ